MNSETLKKLIQTELVPFVDQYNKMFKSNERFIYFNECYYSIDEALEMKNKITNLQRLELADAFNRAVGKKLYEARILIYNIFMKINSISNYVEATETVQELEIIEKKEQEKKEDKTDEELTQDNDPFKD